MYTYGHAVSFMRPSQLLIDLANILRHEQKAMYVILYERDTEKEHL